MNWKVLFITTALIMLSTLAIAAPAFAENGRQGGGYGFGNWLENLSVESESYIKIPSINPGSPAMVEVENMHILKLTIKVNEEVSNVGLTVQQLVAENFGFPENVENFRPPGENFGTPGMSVPGGFQNLGFNRTYRYFRFVAENITDAQVENVIIDFEVEKSWISEHSIDEENISFGRFENKLVEITTPQGESIAMERQVIVDLPTEKVGEDATHIYYFSTTSPGFSYFAITGRSEVGSSENSSGKGESSGGSLSGVAMMAIVVVCVVVLFYGRKKWV